MKYKYYSLRTYYNIISKDLKDKFPLSLTKKIKLWRAGFLAEKYTLYQLDKNPMELYQSDFHTSMARWINEPYNDLLTNKFMFSKIVGQKVRVPVTYGIIINGKFNSRTQTDLKTQVDALDKFVLKPVTGGGGKGVFLVEKKSDGQFIFNNTKVYSSDEFYSFLARLNNYIFTEYIKTGSFSNKLNPNCVNTMRVLTLIDPETNKAFIARAVQRIGVAKSAPQDNFTKGGLSAMINLKTGELSDATAHPKTLEHKRHSVHPDTKLKFEGLKIPDWTNVKDEILKAAESLPMLKCVGWDFVLSDNGLVAIEGNHHPDPDVLQGHGPLFADEKIKRFYKYYKIIN